MQRLLSWDLCSHGVFINTIYGIYYIVELVYILFDRCFNK